jgi:glycosyltransferase involved in cell wall biosynthesis
MRKIKISVIIITRNEENNIADCLESVIWADDIIVVDSFSTDMTVEIAKKYTNRVYQREWTGYAKQKEYALSLANHKWVLSLDADERLSDELRESIFVNIIAPLPFDGYYISRRNYFLGKWIKSCGWYPGYQLRYFKKEKTKVTDRKVHEAFVVDGEVGYLNGDIIHNTHPNIEHIIKKINEYSTLQAEEKWKRKRAHWYNILLNPAFDFFHHYFIRHGFTDGIYGLLVSIIHTITSIITYMKIWEMQKKKKRI